MISNQMKGKEGKKRRRIILDKSYEKTVAAQQKGKSITSKKKTVFLKKIHEEKVVEVLEEET